MNTTLPDLIDRCAGLRVAVLGEAMLDCYLRGQTGRLCREAPVPIVTVTDCQDAPGGAANTAVNAHSLGAEVTLLSLCGSDHEGERLRYALETCGVATEAMIVHPLRRTLTKQRVLAGGQMLVRFDQGSTEAIEEELERMLIDHLAAAYAGCDAVIVSDYGYGMITPRIIEAIAELQSRTPRVLVVDSRNLAAYRDAGVTASKPNYGELVHLLNDRELTDTKSRADAVLAQADRILALTGARIAAVTLDSEGAVIVERGRPPYRTYTHPHHFCCATGAGDTFTSALALALTAGADTPAAAELASAAAALVVGKDGTASCSARELREQTAGEDKQLADLSRLAARVEFYRQRGQKIVFTNGCFDILHRGHVTYLSRAKALGDMLIVGVNSDASIRRLKEPGRPINPLEDRLQVLAALSCIDHIIAFDEDTPSRLIRAIRPDVFVKGGDYTRETLPEAPLVEELGCELVILPYVEDRSTTGIIERIRRAYA